MLNCTVTFKHATKPTLLDCLHPKTSQPDGLALQHTLIHNTATPAYQYQWKDIVQLRI
jgi:hypothetical protein